MFRTPRILISILSTALGLIRDEVWMSKVRVFRPGIQDVCQYPDSCFRELGTHVSLYLSMAKPALRFCCQHASFDSLQNGFSLP
jgi:hypothetical protein